MAIIGLILAGIGYLGIFVCWIMVLIKMFKTQESPLMGILGIFCGLWAFIWGWMNAAKYDLKKIMMLWSAAWVLAVIGAVISVAAAPRIDMNQTAPITSP